MVDQDSNDSGVKADESERSAEGQSAFSKMQEIWKQQMQEKKRNEERAPATSPQPSKTENTNLAHQFSTVKQRSTTLKRPETKPANTVIIETAERRAPAKGKALEMMSVETENSAVSPRDI